jgi:hypothetical protein
VRTKGPREDRVELEFDSPRAVSFGETIVLERRHTRAFRVVALIIPGELGLAFQVVDVRIGPRSQLRDATRPLKARAFSAQADEGLLCSDVCQPNQAFAVEVRNIDSEERPRAFHATVIAALVQRG